jgi:hypothetical protein
MRRRSGKPRSWSFCSGISPRRPSFLLVSSTRAYQVAQAGITIASARNHARRAMSTVSLEEMVVHVLHMVPGGIPEADAGTVAVRDVGAIDFAARTIGSPPDKCSRTSCSWMARASTRSRTGLRSSLGSAEENRRGHVARLCGDRGRGCKPEGEESESWNLHLTRDAPRPRMWWPG